VIVFAERSNVIIKQSVIKRLTD